MDGRRFDQMARTLANGVTRRTAVRRIGGAVVAAGLALIGHRRGEATVCRQPGRLCRENANCCNGLCGGKNETGRRTCLCDDGRPACHGKCCVFSDAICVEGRCVSPPQSGSVISAEEAWRTIFATDALAPKLSFVGFAPQAGQPFQIRTGLPGGPESVVDCIVVAADVPRRLVFTWRTQSMAQAATAELTLEDTEKGARIGVNRVAGDPATCDVATALLGRNWQHEVFAKALPRYLERMRNG